jgi:hypothetical protein
VSDPRRTRAGRDATLPRGSLTPCLLFYVRFVVGMRAADGATLVGVPQLTGLPKICADAVLR